jgi:bifunctional UDP-N-acetylglucosamine pyrophosphorylase/glucosamine-1-phosphate N-acetyltransferase
MKNITTVILAAGKSSRFKNNTSKIFQDLGGLSIIEHVYQLAKKISKNRIVFVCNEDNISELQKKFSTCFFVVQKNQKGTADAIISAKKYLLHTNALVLFGDVPLITYASIKKLINNFSKNKLRGSMIAFKTDNPFGYGRVKTQGDCVTSVVEELNASSIEKKINLCNAGVMLCNSKLLFTHITKISKKNTKKEKYLPDIFHILHNIDKSFTYVLSKEDEMLGVNSIKDLIKIDKIYQKKIKDRIINKGVIIIEPDTVRLSFDTIVKRGVTIEPFVFIKRGVIIEAKVTIKSHSLIEACTIGKKSLIGPHARIRPNSKIGANVKIGNYVEVKNSIIGDNCSINHLSYVGDSLFGKNINVGAGTITCNYDGKKKHKSIIEDGVFIGSNSSLIAPIKVGKNSIIGAGSVITDNIPPNSLALERSKLKIIKKNRKK